MTKARIAIFTAIFLAFLILGFGLAYKFRDRLVPQKAEAAAAAPEPARKQQNVLIIHVDDLNAPEPKLISVWVVFVAEYDGVYVSFKSLYPDPLSSRPLIPVSVLFSLNDKGQPSEAFYKWIRDHNLEWTGYFLVDHQALEDLAGYLDKDLLPLELIIPRNRDQHEAVWKQEARFVKSMCAQLNGNEKKDRPPFGWVDLIPDHLRTDLSFERAILVWETIKTSENAPYCEVFGLN